MNVTTVEAEGKLEELLRRAANGEEVVITGPDRSSARLVPVHPQDGADTTAADKQTVEERLAILREIRERGGKKAIPGPSAARSQDFLYDEHGLPI